ncbi:unnamed protein product [Thelazia callipaeda]|uniref:Reverse transcriptase domain-containing protein n=1 Tax=Thelazia callipaeda TaxID=103827 RepID=A0A0N5CVQ9_THECL|nr:unnamed protein product [Thelazia callipaeda]
MIQGCEVIKVGPFPVIAFHSLLDEKLDSRTPSEAGTLTSGSVVQATQIGQPIQLPIDTNIQPIQLIALNLPESDLEHFKVQLPSVT